MVFHFRITPSLVDFKGDVNSNPTQRLHIIRNLWFITVWVSNTRHRSSQLVVLKWMLIPILFDDVLSRWLKNYWLLIYRDRLHRRFSLYDLTSVHQLMTILENKKIKKINDQALEIINWFIEKTWYIWSTLQHRMPE